MAATFHNRLRFLYYGNGPESRLFRFSMLTFDVVTLAFFVVASLLEPAPWIRPFEFAIGFVILCDFAARFWLAPSRAWYFRQPATWLDLIVIVSLIAPVFFESVLFLRVLRALRLLRSHHVVNDLRKEFGLFKRHEEVIHAVINLTVFIFVMTSIVYVLHGKTNPGIHNYFDALYFTVTALTTTGFGDITLHGTAGRLLSVVIMVVGISLFLRLVQAIFRPEKVNHTCPDCGLTRHDPDAVHCKHCGRVIKIETEGA